MLNSVSRFSKILIFIGIIGLIISGFFYYLNKPSKYVLYDATNHKAHSINLSAPTLRNPICNFDVSFGTRSISENLFVKTRELLKSNIEVNSDSNVKLMFRDIEYYSENFNHILIDIILKDCKNDLKQSEKIELKNVEQFYFLANDIIISGAPLFFEESLLGIVCIALPFLIGIFSLFFWMQYKIKSFWRGKWWEKLIFLSNILIIVVSGGLLLLYTSVVTIFLF